MKVKNIPTSKISEFMGRRRVDECESEITLTGDFWIANETFESFRKEFRELIMRYRI